MEPMNLDDYLLNLRGRDWAQLLSTWGWLLTRPFIVRLGNRFGDLFLEFEDGTVHVLDVGSGVLEMAAPNLGTFETKLADPVFAQRWLLMPLVDELRKAGTNPGPDQCYSYVMPPVFGGEYEPKNIVVRDLATHYAAFGPIHEKIKDLPDGSQITLTTQG